MKQDFSKRQSKYHKKHVTDSNKLMRQIVSRVDDLAAENTTISEHLDQIDAYQANLANTAADLKEQRLQNQSFIDNFHKVCDNTR